VGGKEETVEIMRKELLSGEGDTTFRVYEEERGGNTES